MKKPKRAVESHSTDNLMRNTAYWLLRDFQDDLDTPEYIDLQLKMKAGSIPDIRSSIPAVDYNCNPFVFKRAYQVESILKRYRFENDLYSEAELSKKAVEGFLATQNRLKHVDLDSLPLNTQWVLEDAAKFIARVLGPYNEEEHRSLCRFGRKASVGVPARMACEAARWEIPISGTLNQIDWFRSEMDGIEHVQEYLARQMSSRNLYGDVTYQVVDSLRLTLVPKTFKSLRSIMPNTTIGSYMTFGIGEIMRKRLQRIGYDIRKLQHVHRRLARSASVDSLLTTADLSAASDSITLALVEKLFPPDWVDVLHRSRVGKVALPDGSIVESLTYSTMGVGYTFPLQTLIFLSLLKAIQGLQHNPGKVRLISVYGDDLMYPSSIHGSVVRHFEQLGFVINLDKTFHEGHFRESCGGDYFHGVDVRPFQPRNGSATVGRIAYEATLYKYINGLLMRWHECEIGLTLKYLLSEVVSLVNVAKVVPGDFPDDSGIRCPLLGCYEFLPPELQAKTKFLGHGLYRFSYLRLSPDVRKEDRHEPYYWLALRNPPSHHDYGNDGDNQQRICYKLAVFIDQQLISGYISPFKLRDEPITPSHRSSDSKKARVKSVKRPLHAKVTCVVVNGTGHYTRQSGTSCFEDRRQA